MLDELKEQAALQAPVAVAGDLERDRQREMPVLAALRGNYLGRSGRYRQGVVFPRAMYAEQAREMAAHLRRGVMLGESLALLACLGGFVGLTVSVAPDIAFGEGRREGGPAFRLDLDDGCAGYDLDRVLEHAEKSCMGQSCQPASRVVLVRLPGFLEWSALGRPSSQGEGQLPGAASNSQSRPTPVNKTPTPNPQTRTPCC